MGSSAQHRLGLADCPECAGQGTIPLGIVPSAIVCPECNGAKKVTLARHHELIGLKSIHETPIPPTEPDPRREE